jgi:hypothetical protein
MLKHIEDVLDLADERVAEIERLYDAGKFNDDLSGRIEALIREAVVGYRSAMERTANAVVTKTVGERSGTYWPNAHKQSKWKVSFDRNLPGVRALRPDIAKTFEKYQSYNDGCEWVADIMALYRTEQHHGPTEQIRREASAVRVTPFGEVGPFIELGLGESGGVRTVRIGARHGGAMANEIAAESFGDPPGIGERVTYADWTFVTTGRSVLATLRTTRHKIRYVLQDIGSVSGL